ncbi:TetR family transcriptional regulator [Nocardia sp. NPDC006630]|uniref:TetR/AcrR family transcriptional regulator n=1 Tax=Nocardia sp. NPDC006630 TaxID=3157181 RepID=UPI0033B9B24A
MTATAPAARTGVRARTRAAILDAAAEVLTATPTASLGQIATAAEVGRTTLHRYFPERIDLLRALARHVTDLSSQAIVRAEPMGGTPLAALRRVVEGQFALGPILLFVYTEPSLAGDSALWDELDRGDDPVDAVLVRMAEATGSTLPLPWIRRTFWALLYAGWEAAKEDGTPRHELVDAIMTTLTRGVLPEPEPA